MSQDVIVVLNSGSSSIKFSLFEANAELKQLFSGQIEGLKVNPHFVAKDQHGTKVDDRILAEGNAAKEYRHPQALEVLFEWIDGHLDGAQVKGVGHRVVHGGTEFAKPVLVNKQIEQDLIALKPLAPLHQPHNMAAISRLLETKPALPQVACFDTAFHRTQKPVAQMFAIPREITEAGVKRYGFHGLSYEYIASQLPAYLGDKANGKVVVAHLGSGCSMCALDQRLSVESSMGFTALDGLIMGTRCGSIDAGVLLYLMNERGMGYEELTDLLYKKSGLLGVSGISNDMRNLLESQAAEAAEAVELFVRRVVKEIGALTAVLEGFDALVFTAGVGEHSDVIRERVCSRLSWMGLKLDPSANQSNGPRISADDSAIQAWVIPTNEEKIIAHHSLTLLSA
jgi:acetate kinase